MTTRIKIRRDTTSNWAAINPILADGEIGFETDTRRMKVGDGVNPWTLLNYGPVIDSSNISNAVLTSPTMVSPSGSGFTSIESFTSGSSWTIPTALRVNGAKWKVTLVGGGGGGGGTSTTAGQVGGGGGSGGVCVGFYTYSATAGNTMTFSIGAAGAASATNAGGGAGGSTTTTYNAITFTAGGGGGGAAATGTGGGAGGTASGGTLNLTGDAGDYGGTMAATSNYIGNGGDAPLGLGQGGEMPAAATGADGASGVNYGAGGSGGRNGTGTTARIGAAGTVGIVIIEY